MSSVVVALVFGIGAAAFAWSYIGRMTGNARPVNTLVGAGIVGALAFFVLLSLFKWVLNI
jgi:RsiW-degrading membrane proteinase PrsW (M82 family)